MQKLIAAHPRRLIALYAAVVCSLSLTIITIMPPIVAGDWARLNQFGIYIPNYVPYNWPSYALQFSLWMGLMLALLWAFADSKIQYIPNIPRCSNRQYIPIITLITLLGFGLRLYTLERLPLLVDEIGFAARASDMLHGQHIPIFAPGHNGNPATFSWLIAGAMAVFGQNRFAIRLIALAFGTLCIPAAYALGRAWWSRKTGLIAAAFLATYPTHVYFSRLALYNLVDPFFVLSALAVLRCALHRMRLSYFALVGILTGIAQYFYHGSRLLPVLIIVYILFQTFNTKTPRLKGTEKTPIDRCVSAPLCLGVMLLAFGLTSLPRFAPMFMANLPLTGNLNSIRLPADLEANSIRSILAWVNQPDVSPFWLTSEYLLPAFALVACVIGLVICLRYLRDPRHAVIVMSLVLTTVFGGMIWTASPLYVRYMTAIPALVLLVALPFETTWFKGKRWIWIIVAIIVLQGAMISLEQPTEALTRVRVGLWEQDQLAYSAAQLPAGVEAKFKVSADFGAVDRITIADYVAAYGQRRAVMITTK